VDVSALRLFVMAVAGWWAVLLPLGEPADQRRQKQAEGARVEHGGRVYINNGISGLQDPSAEQ
jgi:hypothetical protein